MLQLYGLPPIDLSPSIHQLIGIAFNGIAFLGVLFWSCPSPLALACLSKYSRSNGCKRQRETLELVEAHEFSFLFFIIIIIFLSLLEKECNSVLGYQDEQV